MKACAVSVWFTLVFVSSPPRAYAEELRPQRFVPSSSTEPAYDPPVVPRSRGVHLHDGFMLRLMTGPGMGLSRHEEPAGAGAAQVHNRGFALPGALSIGGTLREGWSLHAELGWIVLVRPHTEREPDRTGQDASRIRDLSAQLGLGLTRQLGRQWFVTAALGPALSVEDRDGGRIVQTNVGLGVSLGAGKGFWVADQWSLGVGVRAWYSDAATRFVFDLGRMRLFAAALAAVVELH